MRNVDDLRNLILEEDHGDCYSNHPSSRKMYHNLRDVFLWEGLKGDMAGFVEKCPNCQQVIVDHRKTGGLLHEILVPTWKWEDINVEVRGACYSFIYHIR